MPKRRDRDKEDVAIRRERVVAVLVFVLLFQFVGIQGHFKATKTKSVRRRPARALSGRLDEDIRMTEAESSRICVKGLPKRCDEKRLRDHFAARGSEVTDVRVMRTTEGKSRLFGFVGFRTPNQAEAARAYFARSFIDTSRITIELAKPQGHTELARPWSRHSKGSSAYARSHPEEAAAALGNGSEYGGEPGGGAGRAPGKKGGAKGPSKPGADVAEGPAARAKEAKLNEFLGLMQPNSKKQMRLWSNDDSQAVGAQASGADAGDSAQSGDPELDGGASDDDYEEVQGELDGEDEASGAARAPGGGAAGGGGAPAAAEQDPWAAEAAVSHLDWLRSKAVSSLDVAAGREAAGASGKAGDAAEEGEAGAEVVEEEAEEEEGEEGEEEEVEGQRAERRHVGGDGGVPWGAAGGAEGEEGWEGGAGWDGEEGAEGGLAEEELVDGLDEGRLFVRNLPYLVTEPEMQALFGQYGRVDEIVLPMDGETRRAKGYAQVSFSICEHAVRALTALDGSIFQGRILHVLPARARARKPADAAGGAGKEGTSSFKRKKEEELKATAGSSHNWNPLFMRAEAVGDAMADRYGVDKRAILDADGSDSLAVRLAQGETHMISQTKAWLASSGVSLEALERLASASANGGAPVAERSQTLILVKNIDGRATREELTVLFSKHGQIAHVLLAPGNAIALVEFVEVGEAKRAFRAVAYSKLRGVPIFLEWAPVGVLASAVAPRKAKAKGGAAGGPSGAEGEGGAEEAEEADDGGEGRTVFVKNLSFKTTSDGLKAFFGANGFKVRSASVVQKRDPKAAGRTLSMGYGFVEFANAGDAAAALRRMGGARLDEHLLQLKLSSRVAADGAPPPSAKRREAVDGASKAPSNKLLVRNVPFEANKRELKELFSAFGQLKTLRIPKKFDGTHRGFAFVEFVSKAEATKAMEALQSTHLYGRHLVLGYADKEASIEAMRDKMQAQVGGGRAKRQRAGGLEDETGLEGDPEALLEFDL